MNAVESITGDSIGTTMYDHFAAVRHGLSAASPVLPATDVSVELLNTIAGVLDIRAVFPRVSDIARRVLPHDCLELLSQDRPESFVVEARSAEAFPERRRCRVSDDVDSYIVGDLCGTSAWLARCDPPDFLDRLIAAGYRSLLSVRSLALDQAIRVGFYSKQPDAFDQDDVSTAQHIVNHIAVAVAHEQLAKAQRQQAEERGRSEHLQARVRTVIESASTGRVAAIGRSDVWRQVLTRALQVSATETNVFLQGESGTGKEVVARFIHQASPRKDGPFVAINCAALPEQLLESELFGYERGAFTGAHLAKPGQIELASRGVLFLDEVSEMSPTAQAKFLRFLQEREFQRLGGTRLVKANVRVIAASNRDLRAAVEQGTFREDLFYRLQVFDIVLPPLRERTSDIALLSESFLQEFSRAMGLSEIALSPEAQEALATHSWPGNVRELRNVLERAVILCDGSPIARRHLSLHRPSTPASPVDLNAAERRTIEQVLRETDWNKSKAARRLGLTRTQLYVRLRKYSLENQASA